MLATGRRVLVVSHGKTALRVIQEQLPEGVRDLAISVTCSAQADEALLRSADVTYCESWNAPEPATSSNTIGYYDALREVEDTQPLLRERARHSSSRDRAAALSFVPHIRRPT
jgi:hypothetical protein